MSELTTAEREFVIWALGFVEGAVPDDKTSQEAQRIAEKLKSPENQ